MNYIPGVKGAQYSSNENDYLQHQQQYASSTYQEEHNMRPGLIVMAEGINDIQLTVDYARKHQKAISIRTGGHQYSGASSTSSRNILLDLSSTFKSSDDLKVVENLQSSSSERFRPGYTYVRTSVSRSLGEFIKFLSDHNLFVPTGQCTDVHLGGHVQTGGFGQLCRSFGLLGDQVISLEVVDAHGKHATVTRQTHPEQFFALLGGSPGNLGVVTHFTLKVFKDSDYDGSRGLLCVHLYSRDKLNQLLDILVKMSDDKTTPRNYDLCVNVVSKSFKLFHYDKETEGKLKKDRPDLFRADGKPNFSSIIVYAQWVKFSPDDKPDNAWFTALEQGSISHKYTNDIMSKIIDGWLFTSPREFEYPYVKRTYLTDSSSLGRDGWAKWFSDHIDKICDPDNGLFVSSQIQFCGGKFSQFANNAGNGTSYSWRDSTLGCTVDCFHEANLKWQAEAWAAKTDKMIGPRGVFAKHQRRLLWGSFGEWDMKKVWQYYYDNEDVYKRLQVARKHADPDGTFSPNPFCVPRN